MCIDIWFLGGKVDLNISSSQGEKAYEGNYIKITWYHVETTKLVIEVHKETFNKSSFKPQKNQQMTCKKEKSPKNWLHLNV